jgi:predicted RNA-binding protein YlxR (DUF448 family)
MKLIYKGYNTDNVDVIVADFDRKLNSRGYWFTPNNLYIDYGIFKNSILDSGSSYNKTLLRHIQSELKSAIRNKKIKYILND